MQDFEQKSFWSSGVRFSFVSPILFFHLFVFRFRTGRVSAEIGKRWKTPPLIPFLFSGSRSVWFMGFLCGYWSIGVVELIDMIIIQTLKTMLRWYMAVEIGPIAS